MRAVIGIDRKIKRAWLDVLLDHLAQTTEPEELRRFMDERLAEELPGAASRAKSVGISLKIWSGIPANRVPLRDRAVALLPKISGQERIWLHWGMTSLAYPFFRDTAEVVGRLLTLQDDFTTAQVQERLLKKWGDRATTKEAAQKLLNTLVDWEVLRSTKTKGHFLLVARMSSTSTPLQLWLLEVVAIRQLGRGGRGTTAPPPARDVPVHAVDRAVGPPTTRRLPSPSSGTGHGYGLGATRQDRDPDRNHRRRSLRKSPRR